MGGVKSESPSLLNKPLWLRVSNVCLQGVLEYIVSTFGAFPCIIRTSGSKLIENIY